MITFTVDGQSCNPNFCLVVNPGHWTFTGSIIDAGNVLDIQYEFQSITPPGSGGTIQVVLSDDSLNAASVSTSISGVDLNGSAQSSATVDPSGKITETLTLIAGANGKTAGDFQGVWIPKPPVPPPCTVNCTPPPPPCVVDCTPPPCTVNCTPPPPPETCADHGLIGNFPDCMQPPPPPPPPCTQNCSPVPPDQLQSIPTLGEVGLVGLGLMIGVAAFLRLRGR